MQLQAVLKYNHKLYWIQFQAILKYKYKIYSSTSTSYVDILSCVQDTMVALEALAEYDVKRPSEPFRSVQAEFFVAGRSDRVIASISKPTDRVEVELKVPRGEPTNYYLINYY